MRPIHPSPTLKQTLVILSWYLYFCCTISPPHILSAMQQCTTMRHHAVLFILLLLFSRLRNSEIPCLCIYFTFALFVIAATAKCPADLFISPAFFSAAQWRHCCSISFLVFCQQHSSRFCFRTSHLTYQITLIYTQIHRKIPILTN